MKHWKNATRNENIPLWGFPVAAFAFPAMYVACYIWLKFPLDDPLLICGSIALPVMTVVVSDVWHIMNVDRNMRNTEEERTVDLGIDGWRFEHNYYDPKEIIAWETSRPRAFRLRISASEDPDKGKYKVSRINPHSADTVIGYADSLHEAHGVAVAERDRVAAVRQAEKDLADA